MGELVSHRFMYEGERQRIAQRERELRRQEMREKKAKEEKSFPKDIKQTMTSQLRSIACAPRIEPTPFELWQMPRFRSNARPKLDTFRRRKLQSSAMPSEVGDEGRVERKEEGVSPQTERDFPVALEDEGRVEALVAEAVAGPDKK